MDAENIPKFSPLPITRKPRRGDIIGQARDFVDDFILSINSEVIYNKMGIQPDKTFLISGPPGNGKTMGIEALVNEMNSDFYDVVMSGGTSVPNLVAMKYDIGKYGTAYINMGSKIVQQFFDECYRMAKGYKTLIIFDEAENIFGNRQSNSNHKEDSKLLDTIMKNIQTVHDTNNMYAVMMSNFPEAFDEASIRAGRVDKRYEFIMPKLDERKLGYEHAIHKINKRADYQVVRSYNSDALAELTDGYSYADIVESVNSAVKKRAVEISKSRTPGIVPAGYISQKRLEESIKDHGNKFIQKYDGIGFKNERKR
jgi:transitional endoplasmic reticulum ATPase